MAETFKINDVEYEFEFELSNPDKQKIKFTKSAIKTMNIVDNFFEPFMSGSITIANPYDLIEDDYFIRGDGRDELKVKFKEKNAPQSEAFENTFVLMNDGNTVNPATRAENLKTFVLVAKDSIKFSDKIPYNIKCSGKIGKVIQDLFIEVLGEEYVDKENWEEGDFEISYTPPATFRYMDLLRYLLRYYYAKDDDIYVKAFISYDLQKKKYSLDILSKIYKDHKKHELEAFSLGDLTSESGSDNENNPPPGPKVSTYIGGLNNFGFSTPLYVWNNDYFINSLVIGYDRLLGVQNIKKIKFDDIREKWSKKFVDPFKSVGGKPKHFAVKNNSTDKRFKRYKFPYSAEDGVKIVESEIHNNLTFYNLQGSYSTIGRTERRSGKFIDIFSPRKTMSPNDKLKIDQKILGRWFVTEIRHLFYGESYNNQIFCTKTYIGPKGNVKEDVE